MSTMLVLIVSGITNTQIWDAGTLLLLSLVAGLQGGLPRFESNT
jgi:hypothetical protein